MDFTSLKHQMLQRVIKIFSSSLLSSLNKDAIWLYHFRLGHPSFRVLKIIFLTLFKGLDIAYFYCDVCEFAKDTHVTFHISKQRSSHPFHLIHIDIWGPSTVPNILGSRWFVSLIDAIWLIVVSFLTSIQWLKTNLELKRKKHSNNAQDYFNKVLSPYYQKEGIIRESSCESTPKQNKIDERKNGHLLNSTRALLFHGNVPKTYWGEGLLHTRLIDCLQVY